MADRADVRALIELLRAYSVESERYVEVRGAAHGLHRTHLHALAHVMQASARHADLTAGELAAALNLSPPATSALLERLETAGHVVRRPSGTDRRRVSISATPSALSTGGDVFGPLGREIGEVLAGYDPEQVALISTFLTDVIEATVRAREGDPKP